MVRKPVATNSLLNLMVVNEKQRDTYEVIEHLRKKTGEDLGDNPTNWIDKFLWQQLRPHHGK